MMSVGQPGVVVAVAAVVLLGPATAGAAGPPSATGAVGVISTVAGGAGGPARATRVALDAPCGVSSGGGRLYIGAGRFERYSSAGGLVRAVDPGSGWLTTAAGTGAPGPLGDGGPAARASLGLGTCGVATDHAGNLVIADRDRERIRVVATRTGTFYGKAMTAGRIYAVAGDGRPGFYGDGGPATSAELRKPGGVAVDAAGNLVIADTGSARVRVAAARAGTFYGQPMTGGDIYTIAGTGRYGFSGDGGPATAAELRKPGGVAVDAAGNVLIADAGNSRVRVVAARAGTFYGKAMTAGDIYTIAGDGTRGFSGDGGPASAAELNKPGAVAADAAGNVLIADTGSNRIRVAAARTGTFYGKAMTAGDIYTVAGDGHRGFSGDGRRPAAAELNKPGAVAADAAGNLLIADTDNSRVRMVAARTGIFYGQPMTRGRIYTIAGDGAPAFSGDGGPATRAQLDLPSGVAADAAGNVLIADFSNARVRVAARRTGRFYGRAMTAGDIYTVAGDAKPGFAGDGGPATRAELSFPQAVAVDRAGDVAIADVGSQRIRLVAARTGTFYGQPMTAGDIYTVAGDGKYGFAGDGGPATRAELNVPQGVATDTSGNLLIDDRLNNRIRVVAARTGIFYGQPMTAGDIYTAAGNGKSGFAGDGGPATAAELGSPEAVAADGAGNLLIADTANARIRVVAARTGTFYGQPMTGGRIYTVAGNGTWGFAGDGGPAATAQINFPEGVAADGTGNLLIGDTGNGRVRVVAAKTGTFYGQPMTAGDIYTVAGTGPFGFAGDGGPATHAQLGPFGVAADSAGNLLIADEVNGRIRKVTG